MKVGAVTFQGAAGNHIDSNGGECGGRAFDVKFVGTGAVYTNIVTCRLCGRELVAYETGLAPEPTPAWTDVVGKCDSR
jgi:hypothetical protein